MKRWQRLSALVAVVWTGGVCPAATVLDQAVQVTAGVEEEPPRLRLAWPASAGALSYEVFRRTREAVSWGVALATLPGTASNYVDEAVEVGVPYEYRVKKADLAYGGEGYLCAGIAVPLIESRGVVLLVVESGVAVALGEELRRLTLDLVGDGWTVRRHDVARDGAVAEVKSWIRAAHGLDPTQVRALFLLGHVPVPYSGDAYPDNHPDHRGAWPADVFYADVDGEWTDVTVNRATATDARNWNVPGDGKFDQTRLPSDVELEVGRVDFANLPAFGESEGELLRRYLAKNHAFRQGRMPVQRRGLIDDHFGVGVGEAYAVSGWRNFAAFFGPEQTFTGDWLTTLGGADYLWGYGCGAGTYTSVAGVVSTSQLVTADPRVVFTMLHGSYFGDWDATNNVMRAGLATPGYTLTSAWAGRPHWQFHHMGLGETIGHSTRLVQNNDGTHYQIPGFGRFIHIALMGDPTLRMHPVQAPHNLRVQPDGSGGVDLSWEASGEVVEGYVVGRASNWDGPFTRLHFGWVTSTRFRDEAPVLPAVYCVRAVKLEACPGGSYYNPSQGTMEDTEASHAAPRLTAIAGSDPASIQLEWPSAALGFRLEYTLTLEAPEWAEWTAGQTVESSLGGRLRREVRIESTQRWFRLRRP